MGCGPSTPSAGEDGSAYHAEVTVYEAGGNSSDDAERVATVMKGPPRVSKEVAVVIVRIMNKEPAFAAEVEAAKTAAGGATPAVLIIAAEQAAAAVGTIYSMVVSLRKQWIESEGKEGRLPEEAPESDWYDNNRTKRNAIHPRLKAAEASLRSILSVVIDEWKLDVGGKAASKTSTKAFKRLPIAEAGPGVPTMLSEIGALVVAHHRSEPDAEWYFGSTPPESLTSVINHFYAARNALVTTLVPAILTDVELYDQEAKIQASAAGPEVLARLAAVAENPNATPLTPERIADLTSISSGSSSSSVPGSKTLARLSHDQMVACSGSIILYKRTSAAVARAEPKLSAPGVVLPGDVKGKERTIYKSAIKYNGDTTKCHDKIRCTVELQTLRDVAVVAEALVELPEFLIVKVKNRFDPAYDALPIGGYRDLQFSGLIKLDDDDAGAASGGGAAYAWCEVQLNLTRMIALKSGKAEGQAGGAGKGKGEGGGGKSGHDAFNMARAINAFAPELFVHDGKWSSDVAKQVAAGLLLDVDLGGQEMAWGKKEAAEFAKAFGSKECRVRGLKMERMELGEVAGAVIAEALKVNTTLTSIGLQRNNLGEVAGAAVAEALKVNTTLTSINLGDNDDLPAASEEAIEAAVARNKAAAQFGIDILLLKKDAGAAIATLIKSNSSKFTELDLGSLQLGEVGGAAIAEALKVNTTLTSINLHTNKLGEVGGAAIAEALKVNTTLTSIDLYRNDLGEVGGAAIAEALKVNTTLTSIDLRINGLGEVAGAAIAEALKVNTTLTSIGLWGTKLGEVAGAAIAEALKFNTTLTSINLDYNDDLPAASKEAIEAAVVRNKAAAQFGIDILLLKKDAGAAIATFIKSNSSEVTEMDLTRMHLGEVGGAAVAAVLKVNTTLTSINLWRNKLGEVGGAAIAEALKVNTTLTTINLGYNKLGEVGGAAIAEALKVNTTLTSIILNSNDLGEVAGAAIAEALKVNTTLTSIELGYNKLGEVGGAAIAEALKVNTTLTSIILNSNDLGKVAGAAIAEALKVNSTLTTINLGGNTLGEVGGAAIAEALKDNTTLTSIDLFNNNIPAASEKAIDAAVARNKAAAK